MIGFALDLYDLYLIVFVAPTIAAVFFPFENPALALAGAYVALAATLIMRPIGAALMGSIADRHGRKRAMVVALLGVGCVTALMGLLPGAHAIGVAAPLLLLALRLVQGLFVGGVFASTLTLATESAPPRWRGLVSGLVGGGGTALGSLLAALALFAATRLFPGDAFAEWGWRAMFLAGGLPVLVSVFVMKHVDESPVWTAKDTRSASPLAPLLARGRHRRALVANIAVVFGVGTFFLLTMGLLPSFLQVVNGLSLASVSVILLWVNLLAFAFAPLSGHLSERYGRRRVLLWTSVVNTIALPVLYLWLAGVESSLLVMLPALLVSGLTIAAFGPLPIFLNERFPTSIRASGTALSINGGFALAGLVPALVNAVSGGPAQLPYFVAGALALAGAVTVATLSRTSEPKRGLI
ncbi:MFS transporter [Nonomuraea endophytica]|uniref:MFS family permease n=1 Tax=Nonomuraea endophytica TaxID=714136 RepID=A0A7W8ELQ4_9ACTN|nr:MFS transporter [Nonomuraea endophytica]MBB5083633.1 MFS family permease [Nonomuraea endophytica]